MKATREQQVALAQSFLRKMEVGKLFIDLLEKKPEYIRTFYSEAWDCPKLANVMWQLEEQGSLPYFVTHEEFDFGECYSILTISPYMEDFDLSHPAYIEELKAYRVYAYVWNVTDDSKSEPGSIYVKNVHKILYRVA